MGRIKTFANNGSLIPADLNGIQDDYEYAFSTYEEMGFQSMGNSAAAATAATYLMPLTGAGSALGSLGAVPQSFSVFGFYFDPADYLANTRSTKMRIRAQLLTNAVAPTTSWTVGLYPVATFGGASGAVPTIATLSAVVTGSTVLFTTPGATALAQANSGDFTMPSAGAYAFGVVNSGTAAAGSVVAVRAAPQLRRV